MQTSSEKHVAVQAQIEIGFERFLEEKDYQAIVTHFGDLGSLKQLPGLAIQRLMQKGYGFRRRGRLEDSSYGPHYEDHDTGHEGCKRNILYGKTIHTIWYPGKEGILQAHNA